MKNKNSFSLVLALLFLFAMACACPKADEISSETSNSNAVDTPLPQANKPESKPILDLFELVGKSAAEIELNIGKPREVKKISDNPAKNFDEEREYPMPQTSDEYSLIVRFLQGKSVQFIGQVPYESGTSKPEDLAKKFGFNVENLQAETFPLVTNWTGNIGAVEFEKIAAMKIGAVYSNLTVISKIPTTRSEEQTKSNSNVSLSNAKYNQETARKIYGELQKLLVQGKQMQPLRDTSNLNNIRKCGTMMRELQPKTMKLRNDFDTLPESFAPALGGAAREMTLCVSCAATALQNCRRAETGLKEWKSK